MSIAVYVHLPAEVRRRVGLRQITVELSEPATFEAAIRLLGAEVDPAFNEVLTAGGGDQGKVSARARPWTRHVLVNERWLDLPRDLTVELHDADHIYFIQPVAGG